MDRTTDHTNSHPTDHTTTNPESSPVDHTPSSGPAAHSADRLMSYDQRHALFRDHADAVILGDASEAHRLERLIYPDHLMAHYLFVLSLFLTCVEDHFGEALDWAELDALIDRLHRHFPRVSPLKTEALVWFRYGETRLFFEVPQAEHSESMWAVCRLVLAGEIARDELDELYERADGFGREAARNVLASDQLAVWAAGGTGDEREEDEDRDNRAEAPGPAGSRTPTRPEEGIA